MTNRTDPVIMVGIPALAVLFMAWVIFATIPVEKQVTGMISYAVAVLTVALVVGPFVMSCKQMKNLVLPADWRHAWPHKAFALIFLVFISGFSAFLTTHMVLEGSGDVKGATIIATFLLVALCFTLLWKTESERGWKLYA